MAAGLTHEVTRGERVLAESVWRPLATAHEARVDRLLAGHLERRRRGEAHPVHDFLFTYYSHRPGQLRRWHPGFGNRLVGAVDHDELAAYDDGAVTREHLESQRPLLRQLHGLLSATARRAPQLGCFGLHEWAMVHGTQSSDVHGTESSDVRHPWPLRLGHGGTDEVVESHRIACSHFDAFRFFTDSARPLNTLRPGRDDRADFEQPGCLHATMDLYKHAFRLTPLIPSPLVVDCFELAWDVRTLDMRAAPYDFTGVTLDPTGEPWTPVRIETPEGKRAYAAAQRAFAERAAPLRARLIEECARLLAA